MPDRLGPPGHPSDYSAPSPELQKAITDLEHALRFFEGERGRDNIGAFASSILLDRAVPQEIRNEIMKLYLDVALEVMMTADVNSKDKLHESILELQHIPTQAAHQYYANYSEPIDDPQYDQLGRGLVKFLGNRYIGQHRQDVAGPVYKWLGTEPPAEPPSSNPESETETYFAWRLEGLREFREEFEDFPVLNDEEWAKRKDELGQKIANEIEALKRQM